MPRNGSGNYSLPPVINPVITQTLITSNWANTTMNDLAAAITASIARDGQSPPTATMPWGNQRLTALANPIDLTDAVNLLTVQNGVHIRATSVTGVNNITASLVGGQQVLPQGGLLVIVPTGASTGPVSLAINGGTAYPVATQEGNQIGAGGFQSGVPYILMFNSGKWIIQSSGSTPAFGQSSISGWDRPASGVYPSIGISSVSAVSIPSGTGRIVDAGAQDYTGAHPVSWTSQNVTITNLSSALCSTVGIDINGNVDQVAGIAAPSWARTHIVLGVVSHPRGQVIGIQQSPNIYGDSAYMAYDLATMFNDSVRSGMNLVGNVSSPLHFDITSGSMFIIGGDRNEKNDPNFLTFTGLQDVGFYPITGTGVTGLLAQNTPITNYDPSGAGTVTAIPGAGQTTVIHRIYLLAGSYFFLYGQNTYPDLITALDKIGVDGNNTVVPGVLDGATLLGYVVAQKNTTDLKSNTAVLAKAGSLGGGAGAGGSGVPEAPIDGFLYGRQNASWLRAAPLAQGNAGTDRFTAYLSNTNLRWNAGANSSAESGANAGSDFVLNRYNDAGTLSGTSLTISRATGKGTFEVRPAFGSATPWDSANLAAPVQTGIGQNVSFGTITGGVITGSTINGTNFVDGTGNLRTAITAAASAASSAQTTANNANTNANNRLPKDGSEAMTGNLPIRKSVPTVDFLSPSGNIRWNVFANISDSVNDGVFISDLSTGTLNTVAVFRTSIINFSKSLDVSGNVTASGYMNATGGWGPPSDPRLKDVYGPIDDVFGRVMALNTCRGKYTDGFGDGRDKLFIMADDQMADKNPEMLAEGVVSYDGGKYNGYDASQTTALLTAGLQLALAEIESLKRKIK